MTSSPNLDQMTPEQLRALAEQAIQLLSQVDSMGQKIHRLETVNEQLAHEIAILKRHKFAKRSEQLSPDQGSLLDDSDSGWLPVSRANCLNTLALLFRRTPCARRTAT